MAVIRTPLWKDCFADLGTATATPYRVRVDDPAGDIVHAGLCTPGPDGSNCTVLLNDIAADYISHTLPTLDDVAFSALTFPLVFYVEIYTGGVWSTLSDSWEFTGDWSYVDGYDPTVDGMAFPVDGIISPLQYMLFTAMDVASVTLTVYYTDGSTDTQTISLAITPDFNADYNRDFARSLRATGSGTAAFRIASVLDASKTVDYIDINGVEFTLDDTCATYVLYYLNAFGGWDSLVVRGNTLRTDALDRLTEAMDYDNRGVQNRGRKDYAIGITRGYTFHTTYLTDDQAARMHHLLESPDVYLHDLSTDIIRPLVLTGKECTFKTFRTNGGRLSQFTITANVAQDFERR